MGAALNTASAMNAYVLADRGTWLSFKNRGDLDIVVEGDKRLFNQYGVMLVNPGQAPACEEGARPGLHRLAGLGRRPEGDRRLQDQRPAAVLPECRRCRARDARPRRDRCLRWHDDARPPTPPTGPAACSRLAARRAHRSRKAFEAGDAASRCEAKFGPSGTLRDEIAAGGAREVFASANMEHPQSLATPARAARSCCSRATGSARWCGPGSRSRRRRCSSSMLTRASRSAPRRRRPIRPATMPSRCSRRPRR